MVSVSESGVKFLSEYKHKILAGYRSRKGIYGRALLAFIVGLVFLFFDSPKPFDFRFKLRGAQKIEKDILIVTVGRNEWSRFTRRQTSWVPTVDEGHFVDDTYYWDPDLWARLFRVLLKNGVTAVGLTFEFPSPLIQDSRLLNLPSLSDNRILWSTPNNPSFPYGTGLAYPIITGATSNDFKPDDDGVIRQFMSSTSSMPHIAQALAKKKGIQANRQIWDINYRGPQNTFPSVSLSDVLSSRVPKELYENRLVIIGLKDQIQHRFQTPLGPLNRAELTANVVDNILHERYITVLPSWFYALGLFAFCLLMVFAIFTYPQFVALVVLGWTITLIVAASLWIFDSFYIWVPILSPIAVGVIGYIIFISYRLSLRDYQKWELEKQKRYYQEIEELKTNFISLISHDLKTPIAKIQAICDRMMVSAENKKLSPDIESLRKESEELHRYIQSILQITRVESRNVKLDIDTADLNELVERAVSYLGGLAQAKRIDITLDLEPMFLTEMDSHLIQEVILNMIENAIKYSPEESRVQLRTFEIDDMVVLQVSNSGAPIPASEQAKVFDKFYRAKASEKSSKGTGLGLFLSRYFVELHQGSLNLVSSDEQQTIFELKLPTEIQSTSIEPPPVQGESVL